MTDLSNSCVVWLQSCYASALYGGYDGRAQLHQYNTLQYNRRPSKVSLMAQARLVRQVGGLHSPQEPRTRLGWAELLRFLEMENHAVGTSSYRDKDQLVTPWYCVIVASIFGRKGISQNFFFISLQCKSLEELMWMSFLPGSDASWCGVRVWFLLARAGVAQLLDLNRPSQRMSR